MSHEHKVLVHNRSGVITIEPRISILGTDILFSIRQLSAKEVSSIAPFEWGVYNPHLKLDNRRLTVH